MLGGLAAAFRTPDLRKKILFTLGLLAIYRLGTVIPTPGVDYTAIQKCVSVVQDNSLYGLINLFSGGALLQLSVFALGIMPYITASIIMQVLGVVIPKLEKLQKEGAVADSEMWRTFNCGIGFVLIVAPDQVAAVSDAVKAQGLEHWTIGQVVTAEGAEREHRARAENLRHIEAAAHGEIAALTRPLDAADRERLTGAHRDRHHRRVGDAGAGRRGHERGDGGAIGHAVEFQVAEILLLDHRAP